MAPKPSLYVVEQLSANEFADWLSILANTSTRLRRNASAVNPATQKKMSLNRGVRSVTLERGGRFAVGGLLVGSGEPPTLASSFLRSGACPIRGPGIGDVSSAGGFCAGWLSSVGGELSSANYAALPLLCADVVDARASAINSAGS
jgi:hypothetical protein